jgi:hypothetical protein
MSTDEVKVESAAAAAEVDGVEKRTQDGSTDGEVLEGSADDSARAVSAYSAGADSAEAVASAKSGDGFGGGSAEGRDGAGSTAGGSVKPTRPKPRRMRDMALSLAVLLVPLGLFFVGWGWLATDRQVSVVDTTEDYATAESLGLMVIEPEVGDGWKPISTDLAVEGERVTLRTGWYSPEGDGLQLVETNGTAAEVNEDLAGPGTPAEAGGINWATYELNDGAAWVAELDGETVVLTAEPDGVNELPELAAAVAEALDA